MSTTVTERILASYKQAFQFLVMSILYSILAIIVVVIGFVQAGDALLDLDFGAPFIIGVLIIAFGIFLFFVGFFAAFLYAATRGTSERESLGLVDAYTTTFKLIAELALAVIFGLVLFIVGGAIGGGLGGLFFFVGGLTFALFPYASQFYVVNYIREY